MRDMEQSALKQREMILTAPRRHARDIDLTVKIQAESSRVLYALGIPEYVEAWLQPPETANLQLVFNLVAQEAFRIDLYRAGSLHSKILCSCRILGANQIRYAWKRSSPAGTAETSVSMRLLYASDGCIISLKHIGFKDTAESEWCYEMWRQSLEKLNALMKKN